MNTYEKLTKARNLIDEALTVKVGFIGHKSLPAEALAYKQKLLSGLNTDREVFDIVNAINALAMANTDVIHIFTRYQGHVDRFFISVEKVETDYSNTNRQYLFNDDVSLKDESSLEELLSIESQLTELIIEAREEAEAKAEVEA
ncbi:TPA: hypothetical protein NJ598_000184 [Vibrio parahaemolyticus]|nr:hypothetical protein [Vibrio parahaemolyticus]